jgi:hypothetical protein
MQENQHLREFLLGGLSSVEAQELEERMFQEEAFYRTLEAERSALIEEYAEGVLTAADARRFEEQCALSPELALQVDEFRLLKKCLTEVNDPAVAGGAKQAAWNRRALIPILATCICLLTIAISIVWWKNRGLRSELTNRARQTETYTVAPGAAPPSEHEAVFFLSASVARGSHGVSEVQIAPGSVVLQLQIELSKSAPADGYWEVLLSHNGHATWEANAVSPRHAGATTYLPIYLDAVSLQDGSYLVRLIPSFPQQNEETRSFSVVRRNK